MNKIIGSITNLNNSRYFAGLMMIILNVGSKYITIELSKTQEQYLRNTLGRQILLFSIFWVGTRDIVTSFVMTAVFVVLSDYLLNENSKLCIVPSKWRILRDELDVNDDGVVSMEELTRAKNILKHSRIN
jgi:spore coat protein CotF